jgi:catechol 2,3-dioxygenase-like lactoylglutathione lyase family enzyme
LNDAQADQLRTIVWKIGGGITGDFAGSSRSDCAVGGTSESITGCEEQSMSNEWFARPVLFVADIGKSVDFYVKQLGFTQAWRYEEEGKAWVDRQGCELILSSQWPDKVGKGLMFVSLDVGVLDALRAELEGRGVDVKDGQWGYRLMVIADPDGNELYFPYPADPSLATGSLIRSYP